MNRQELLKKANVSMYHQLWEDGVVEPVNLLMQIGVLSKNDYTEWLEGGIPQLEKACTDRLDQLLFILKELEVFARQKKLKPFHKSYSAYDKAAGSRQPISISRDSKVERAFTTCYSEAAAGFNDGYGGAYAKNGGVQARGQWQAAAHEPFRPDVNR